MEGFEKFEISSEAKQSPDAMTASIHKSGQIRFSKTSSLNIDIRKKDFVEVYYSSEKEQLAIVKVEAQTQSSFRVNDLTYWANEDKKKGNVYQSKRLFSPSIVIAIKKAIDNFGIDLSSSKDLSVTSDGNAILVHNVKQLPHS